MKYEVYTSKKLTKNKQVTLNKLFLLIYNLQFVVLFTVLKSVTFKIRQTPLFISVYTMSPAPDEKYYEARRGFSTTTKIYS